MTKGVSISHRNSNPFVWDVNLSGFEGSIWANASFQLELHFDEEFNDSPPEIYFLTVPFHPNIDAATGKPCLDILQKYWTSKNRISMILITLQDLLCNPELDNAVNASAANIYAKTPHLYEQLAHDSILTLQYMQKGLPLYNPDRESPEIVTPKKLPCVNVIDFDSYRASWVTMGTTIPVKPNIYAFPKHFKTKNEFLDELSFHKSGAKRQIAEIMAKYVEYDFRGNIYWKGRIITKPEIEKKLSNPKRASAEKLRDIQITELDWEQNAEELVNWSSQLPTEMI
jgi:ubiquitin-protein ligase